MSRRKVNLIPLDRSVVELTANILGPDSAAALALQAANAHDGLVQFWESDHSIIVQKLPVKRVIDAKAI